MADRLSRPQTAVLTTPSGKVKGLRYSQTAQMRVPVFPWFPPRTPRPSARARAAGKGMATEAAANSLFAWIMRLRISRGDRWIWPPRPAANGAIRPCRFGGWFRRGQRAGVQAGPRFGILPHAPPRCHSPEKTTARPRAIGKRIRPAVPPSVGSPHRIAEIRGGNDPRKRRAKIGLASLPAPPV